MKKNDAQERHRDGEGEKSVFDDSIAALSGKEAPPVFDAPSMEKLSTLPRKDLFELVKKIEVLSTTVETARAMQVGRFFLSKGFRLGVQDVSTDGKIVFVKGVVVERSAISPANEPSQESVLAALKKTRWLKHSDYEDEDLIVFLEIPVKQYDAFVSGSEGARVDFVTTEVGRKAKKALDDETAGRG